MSSWQTHQLLTACPEEAIWNIFVSSQRLLRQMQHRRDCWSVAESSAMSHLLHVIAAMLHLLHGIAVTLQRLQNVRSATV